MDRPTPAKSATTASGAVTIPRSYALVVGIADYQDPNVPKLHYSERDAQSMFDVLISPEGGNFHRENVHLLIGPKATLANLRNELEQWLPGESQRRRPRAHLFCGARLSLLKPTAIWPPTTSICIA